MANNGRTPRRILHTGDLHLESLGSEACDCLKAVVDLAVDKAADLVLIAGDLFDGNRVDVSLIGFAAEQLRRVPAQVVVLPGNHDCLVAGSVYEKVDIWRSAPNVYIITALQGETIALPDLGISIWGKPLTSNVGDARPLSGIPRNLEREQWNIAVAHGYYVDSQPPAFPSFHITEEEIITSGLDYIAMGHVPLFRCVCSEPVQAYYCGSPPAYGTVAIVDLADKTGVQVTCHSL